MILVDANLLIYAYNSSVDVHERARAWLEGALSGRVPVGLPWSTIHAFLRLMTQQTLFPEPLNIAEATAIVESWLAQPIVAIVEPGPAYWTSCSRCYAKQTFAAHSSWMPISRRWRSKITPSCIQRIGTFADSKECRSGIP